MSDRHPKWTPVDPGTVIPAGGSWLIRFDNGFETRGKTSVELCVDEFYDGIQATVFVDDKAAS